MSSENTVVEYFLLQILIVHTATNKLSQSDVEVIDG